MKKLIKNLFNAKLIFFKTSQLSLFSAEKMFEAYNYYHKISVKNMSLLVTKNSRVQRRGLHDFLFTTFFHLCLSSKRGKRAKQTTTINLLKLYILLCYIRD